MISQALYWTCVTDDPQGWFHKSAAEWQQETFVTPAQQERARAILRQTSFWQEERRGLPAKLFYRLDLEELRQALTDFEQNPRSRVGISAELDSVKRPNKKSQEEQSSALEYGNPYKEAEITSKINNRDSILPTPLSKGGDVDSRSNETAATRGQEFRLELKLRVQDVPLNARHLSSDDFGRYFRNAKFIFPEEGPILVETEDDPALLREGLNKYGKRMRKLAKGFVAHDVEFQIAHEGHD